MIERFTDEQLHAHLVALGQWTATRAVELQRFTEHLPQRLAEGAENPRRQASVRYALGVYVGALQEMARRWDEARAEFEARAVPAPSGSAGEERR